MILIHVDDAARGLVCLTGDPERTVGKPFVLTDREPVAMTSFSGLAATLMGVPTPGTVPKWFATLFAGKPIVETTLHAEGTTSTAVPGYSLVHPSYREGLTVTLHAMGSIK